ncbi:MAG TPA: macrolide family glycosyltransferase [Conexibacter sp.]|nr:macrolide family glycosyltransferase [Conexibacter sp.]
MPRTEQPRHFAIFAVPAHGHVNPALGVVAELAARGHRVTFAVTEQFAPAVRAAGATPVFYATTWPTTAEGRAAQWDGDAVQAYTWFLDEAIAVLPQLADAYAEDRPDVVLYDIGGYPGHVLAHRWGVPAVQLSPTYVAWEGYEQEVAAAMGEVFASDAYRAYHARFAAWLEQHGVPDAVDDFLGRPHRCLALIPRALQPNAERVDEERITFVGPALGPRQQQGEWVPPADDRPLLLVSLGSAFTDQPAFFGACLEAFGGLDWHVVMSIGEHVETMALGPVPDNIELHRFVPQLAVLERATAFVTHAGMGSAKEGLAAGVPMIAVPQAVDQFGNADRLVELGVGRRLATDASPAELRAALLELTTDEAVAQRLGALRREIQEEGGAMRAADLLEGISAL